MLKKFKQKIKNSKLARSVRVLDDEDAEKGTPKDEKKYWLLAAVCLLAVVGFAVGMGYANSRFNGMKSAVESSAAATAGEEEVDGGTAGSSGGADGDGGDGATPSSGPTTVPYVITADSRDVTEAIQKHYGLPEGYNLTVNSSNREADGSITHHATDYYYEHDFTAQEVDGEIVSDTYLQVTPEFLGGTWSGPIGNAVGTENVTVAYAVKNWSIPESSTGLWDTMLFKQNLGTLTITVNGSKMGAEDLKKAVSTFLESQGGFPGPFELVLNGAHYTVNIHGEIQ